MIRSRVSARERRDHLPPCGGGSGWVNGRWSAEGERGTKTRRTWRRLVNFPPPVVEFLSRWGVLRVPLDERSEAECGGCSCEGDDEDPGEPASFRAGRGGGTGRRSGFRRRGRRVRGHEGAVASWPCIAAACRRSAYEEAVDGGLCPGQQHGAQQALLMDPDLEGRG